MTTNIWEEPHHAAPGAEYGHLETLEPEDATTLCDNSRLNFERGIVSWRQFRILPQDAYAATATVSSAAYLAQLDAVVTWSREGDSASVLSNLILGSSSSSGIAVRSGGAAFTNPAVPLCAFFGEQLSVPRVLAAYSLLQPPSTVVGEIAWSLDAGANFNAATSIAFKPTHPILMPGGSPDNAIVFGDTNQFLVFGTDDSKTYINVSGNPIQSGAHNENGVVLLAGSVNGKSSTNYGASWSDWAVPYPSGTGISSAQDIVSILYDKKRTEFALFRRAMVNGLPRVFFSNSVGASGWSSWRMLPPTVSTAGDWIESVSTASGVWMVFFLRGDPDGWHVYLAVAYSVDQGLTWRTENLTVVPTGGSQSRLIPALIPANSNHGSHVVIANQWLNRNAIEVFVGGPFDVAQAGQSSIVT